MNCLSFSFLNFFHGEKYRISSFKRSGFYKISRVLGAAFIGEGVY